MGAPMGAAPAPQKKGGCGKIILIVAIILVVLGIGGSVAAWLACRSCAEGLGNAMSGGGQPVTLDMPTTVIITSFTPMLQAGGSERRCAEYPFTAPSAGRYQITLTSIGTGDPFVSVYRDGTEVAYNDDADGLNSRLEQDLEAAAYQIRACTFSPADDQGLMFTLTVSQMGGGAATPTGTPPTGTPPTGTPPTMPPVGTTPPAGGAGGCDALARCCAASGSLPQASVTCGQLDTYRNLPGGAGDSACSTSQQGLRNVYQAMGQAIPADCQ
jgi:hypothetical protein